MAAQFNALFIARWIMTRFVLFPVLCLCLAARASAQAQNAPPHPTISASGTAEIRVAPDEVDLRLGVETRDPKLDEAVRQNENRMTAVLKFLKDSGLESKDIQTDYVEIHPQYNTAANADRVVPEFYLVRRNLGVRLRRVAQFDTVLAGVIKSGANHVMGIEFRTTELRKHRDAARQQAIRAAKEKAVALAQELDAKVGKPQTIHEQTSGGWWGWSGVHWSQVNPMFQNTIQTTSSGEPTEANLSVGLIGIRANVNVTFALE